MKVGSRKILALIAIALLAGVVVAVLLSSEWALIVLGGVQIITLVLLVDTRQALSARIVSTVRNFEQRLRGAGRPKSGGAGASKVSDQKPGSHVNEAEIRLIRASLVFDFEWYQIQVAGRFKSLDDAISHLSLIHI